MKSSSLNRSTDRRAQAEVGSRSSHDAVGGSGGDGGEERSGTSGDGGEAGGLVPLLVAWLSVYGPLAGLVVGLKYGREAASLAAALDPSQLHPAVAEEAKAAGLPVTAALDSDDNDNSDDLGTYPDLETYGQSLVVVCHAGWCAATAMRSCTAP